MKMYRAKYECTKCDHTFECFPMPADCIKCGSQYVKWVNYEETYGNKKDDGGKK